MNRNFNEIMKQAKKMQDQLLKTQQEAMQKTVNASSGGGMVSVTVSGKPEVVSIAIDKEVVNPEEVEMLQDLIMAAINEGIRKSQELLAQETEKITGGFKMPGLF